MRSEVVPIAGDHAALDDLRKPGHLLLEAREGVPVLVLEAELDDHVEPEPHSRRVHQRHVAT